jgi:ubiquinone/menaquinone biosynthesis C-methylase UbiE
MEFTARDKARMLEFIQPGKILECGCGSGTVLGLITAQFPFAEVIGIDHDPCMLSVAGERLTGRNAHLIEMDMRGAHLVPGWREGFSTVIFSSSLHEVESSYGLTDAEAILCHACDLLKKGGVLIWRDGVKPSEEQVLFRIKHTSIRNKFEKFVIDYHTSIKYHVSDGEWIRISAFDLHNFLCKYYFEGDLWRRDMKETFGMRTLSDYLNRLPSSLTVAHSEAYTPVVLGEMWARHFEFRTTGPIASHMLIVARKSL